jgi:predicted  nucleic acid-binding Zn-ribbon protein
MGATLEALQALQDVEHQIVDIQRQLGAKQRSVARQEAKLKDAESKLTQARADLQRAQITADQADVDLKSRDESVAKLRDTLNSVRTNKEYAAVLQQLNNEKADRSKVEARALELLSEVDAKKSEIKTLESTAEDEKGRLAALHTQLEQAQASFDERLTTLKQEREQAAAQIDSQTQALFDRLSERYDGEVMSRIIQVHPRRQEYLCEGCNMSVTAERANAVLSRDEVTTCGSCGRILFIEPGDL